MSEENRRNEDIKENESTPDSDTEIENSFNIIIVEPESSTEMFKLKVDAKDVRTVDELPPGNGESKSSNSEATNIVYEFPDDSEFCQSNELISNLRKRPSDTEIKNASKKPCNEITECQEAPTAAKKKCEIGGFKNQNSESTSDQAKNDPFELQSLSLGFKNKGEGEIGNSNEAIRASLPPGRFTKHKGDTKCQHGNFHASSSEGEDADIEDNAEDSSMSISESSESPPKETPTAETQLQSTIKDLLKKHIKPLRDDKKSKDSVTKPSSGNKKPNTCSSNLVKKHIKPLLDDKKSKDSMTKPTSGHKKPNDSVTKPSSGNKKPNNCSSKHPTTTTTKGSQAITNKPKTAASAKTKPTPDASSNSEAKKPKKLADSNKTSETLAFKSETSSSELSTPNGKSQMTKKKNKIRCGVCNKKLGLTATPCRCKGIFCAIHRYDLEHNCTFDYKAVGAEEIRKNNPKIIGERVKKI